MAPPALGGAAESEVESCDAMLAFETDYDAAPRSLRRKARSKNKQREQGVSFIHNLLSLFRSRKQAKSESPAIDRTPYRPSAVEILQTLQGSQVADASAKLAALRTLSAKLEELFQNLVAAGDRDPSVKALGETLLHLHALLAASQPRRRTSSTCGRRSKTAYSAGSR
ncbi:MAG TPA: hypothetical protein VMG10_23900 [Gemmataceae bacterium]|nr:hypothetical protein [Gemmataceae bacterium]